MKKTVLEAMHGTASDLHEAGLVDKATMHEFDALCLEPVKELSPKQIQSLRKREKVSQPVFAKYLNASPSTVKKWETGEKKPRGTSLKLLNLVLRNGLLAIA